MRLGFLVLVVGCGRFDFAIGHDAVTRPTIDATPTDPYSTEVLADHPVGYWRLGESVGLVALDEVGAHDGTYDPACQLGVPGLVGSDTAVQFDGAACNVTIGDVFAFSGSPSFTIDLWARLDVVDTEVRRLVSRNGGPNTTGYQFAFFNSTLWFEQFLGNGNDADYLETGVPVTGTPFHLAIAIGPNHQDLYVDGVAVATTFTPLTMPDTGSVMFGDLSPGTFYKFQGVIDEVAVYDHVLAADRIAAHFNAH